MYSSVSDYLAESSAHIGQMDSAAQGLIAADPPQTGQIPVRCVRRATSDRAKPGTSRAPDGKLNRSVSCRNVAVRYSHVLSRQRFAVQAEMALLVDCLRAAAIPVLQCQRATPAPRIHENFAISAVFHAIRQRRLSSRPYIWCTSRRTTPYPCIMRRRQGTAQRGKGIAACVSRS